MEEDKITTLRLPKETLKELDRLNSIEKVKKSALIRELIESGMKEKRIENALEKYSNGEVSLWKAAKIAKVPIWKMIEIIKEKKISSQYGEKELKEDLKALE